MTNKYQNQSINQKNMGLNKSGESEKKTYARIQPTHVAKLFNAYFIEITERLQCNFTRGVLKTFSLNIFYTHK
jgi:hypothetical protein